MRLQRGPEMKARFLEPFVKRYVAPGDPGYVVRGKIDRPGKDAGIAQFREHAPVEPFRIAGLQVGATFFSA